MSVIADYAEALKKYRMGDYASAKKLFDKLHSGCDFKESLDKNDGVTASIMFTAALTSELYSELCEIKSKMPPPESKQEENRPLDLE